MDIATIIGLVLAWAAVLLCAVLEGTHLAALLALPAFILIIGGSLGVTMMSFTIEDVKNFPAITKNAFSPNRIDLEETIKTLVSFSAKARKEGILALESELQKISDVFLRKAIQLVADGFDMQDVRRILEAELEFIEERHKVGEEMYANLGGAAPTLGIIGTVLGLVHALGQLDNPAKMGAAIAAAFIATLYGVSFANLVFLPIGNKLKTRNKEEMLTRIAMLEGVLSIQAGDNPRITEEKLKIFLPPKHRVGMARSDKGGGE